MSSLIFNFLQFFLIFFVFIFVGFWLIFGIEGKIIEISQPCEISQRAEFRKEHCPAKFPNLRNFAAGTIQGSCFDFWCTVHILSFMIYIK